MDDLINEFFDKSTNTDSKIVYAILSRYEHDEWLDVCKVLPSIATKEELADALADATEYGPDDVTTICLFKVEDPQTAEKLQQIANSSEHPIYESDDPEDYNFIVDFWNENTDEFCVNGDSLMGDFQKFAFNHYFGKEMPKYEDDDWPDAEDAISDKLCSMDTPEYHKLLKAYYLENL